MADRTSVHDTTVRFRANASLVAMAQDAARKDNKTLAELLRDTLRTAVREPA